MVFGGIVQIPTIAPMLPASQRGFLPTSQPWLTDCPKEPALYPVLMFCDYSLTSSASTSNSLRSRAPSFCILFCIYRALNAWPGHNFSTNIQVGSLEKCPCPMEEDKALQSYQCFIHSPLLSLSWDEGSQSIAEVWHCTLTFPPAFLQSRLCGVHIRQSLELISSSPPGRRWS